MHEQLKGIAVMASTRFLVVQRRMLSITVQCQ